MEDNNIRIGKIVEPNVSPKFVPWKPPTDSWPLEPQKWPSHPFPNDPQKWEQPGNPIQGKPIYCPHCKQLVGYDRDYMYYCGDIRCPHCLKIAVEKIKVWI